MILRIFSLLDVNDLLKIANCSYFLRQLTNHILLTRNVLISAHSDWIRNSLFFNMSQVDLEFIRHDKVEKQQEREQEGHDEQILINMYTEPFTHNNEEVLSYIRILQGVHGEDTKLIEKDHINSPKTCDWENKTEKSIKVVSPTCSDYSKSSDCSKSSVNSTFSELPPKLSSSEWSLPASESNTISNESVHGVSDCESMSSANSLDKLRSSNKVKDKAALFEKLMTKDTDHSTRSQNTSIRRKSYGLLSHFFLDGNPNTSDRKISQSYIEELTRCNGESAAPSNLEGLHNTHQNDDELRCTEEITAKRTYRSNSKGTQRNRLKAFVTEGNKICYEKI